MIGDSVAVKEVRCGNANRHHRIRKLAETEGFEPSVPNYQYDGLANRWFQPLTHVSNAFGIGGL